jgi:LysM repeat protein
MEDRSKILSLAAITCSLLFIHACSTLNPLDYLGTRTNKGENGSQSTTDENLNKNNTHGEQSKGISYIVRRGDTLSSIARQTTGDYKNWRSITEYNKISDPTKIKIGQKIIIPTSLAIATKPKSSQSEPLKASSPPTIPKSTGWLRTRGSNYPREINTKPDPTSDILTQVWPGTRLHYIDRINGWYKVATDLGFGYINPDYVYKE